MQHVYVEAVPVDERDDNDREDGGTAGTIPQHMGLLTQRFTVEQR